MRLSIRIVVSLACLAVPALGQEAPLRVFLRGGPKTHGPGEHDHPRFVEEWTPLLSQRGARVEGALEFPSAEQLARTDVLVMYAAEGGSIHGEQRANLERYLARGGGIVVLHDAVCGDDPHWFKTVVGGAWEHGHSRWRTDTTDLYLSEARHPITEGAANFRFRDEIYWDLHMQPEANVLMVGFHSVFDITPQMWTYEKDDYRAFVSLQGHFHDSFSHAAWRTLLLRGIAWAGKRGCDELLEPGEAGALRYPPGGPTRPDLAHSSIQLHPDFELSLVAAEPVVVKPISVDWDSRGRMWVALTPGYPFKEKFSGVAAHDELAILADRDGDGRMDERTTFHAGLDLVTSFVLHRDGAIVGAAPDILWLRDTDGDDRCDKVETVFTGFGFGDTHAVMSNFRWGPDGWVYATQGYSGGASNHVTNGAGHDFGKIGNGLFRFRPDGSAIEMVSSYGSNTWGCSFTPEGELFFTMANGAHLRHVVTPERFLAGARVDNVASWKDVADHDRVFPAVVRTEAPYAQIDFVGGFTAASGSTFYDGGAWPSEWNSSHFVCEPTVNLVHHDVVEPDGVSFRASKAREAEFITSTDLWFRPVDVRVGPDGALYVLDFYNQAVVHNDTRGPKHGPTNAALRPDRDHAHGRIWRVQHKSAKAAPVAFPLPREAARAAGLLAHPSAWVRNTVVREAVERSDAPFAELATEVCNGPEYSLARVAAGWFLTRAGKPPSHFYRWLFDADASPAMTRVAARMFMEAPELLERASWSRAAVETLSFDDARMRLLAANAIAEAPNARETLEQSPELVALLADASDPWTRSAAVRLASRNPAAFLRHAFASGDGKGIARQVVAAALARDADVALPAVLETLADRGSAQHSEIVEQVLAGIAGVARSIDAKARAHVTWKVGELLQSPSEAVAAAALSLAATWDLTALLSTEIGNLADRLERTARSQHREHSDRAKALEALLTLPERRARAVELAGELLAASSRPAEQQRVLNALATTDDLAAARAICSMYPSLALESRERAFEALMARASWSDALLDSLQSGDVAAAELGPQKVHRLRNHPDAKVSERATKLFESLAGASNAEIDALIAKLLPEVDQPGGDRVRGKALFEQNCATCHSAFGAGAAVGPELTGIGAHGARDLLPILLDPNRTVEAAYAEWIVATTDGLAFSGVLVRDSDDGVVLRSSAGEHVIARDEIESMRNTGRSPMPAGFETLGADGLRDVIAYLAGDFAHWRVLDLKPVVSSNSLQALYDSKRDDKPYVPARYGVVPLEGVPFEFLDPRRTDSGCNALVLKGGLVADWESKLRKPQRVEIPVGTKVQRVHVLGGIAGWGFPYVKERKPIVKWTWRFADGSSAEHVLHNAEEFADWIGRFDVPGSEFVEGALSGESWGQLRRFAVELAEPREVERIVLESYDNELAPTILAMTAELPGAPQQAERSVEALDVLILGGGTSHDYAQWFERADLATLRDAGIERARYTASLGETERQLEKLRALVLCTNQPVASTRFREALFEHVERGGGLLVLHPSNWFNWQDWPEYNARLVGGGSRSHEKLQEFEVRIVDASHAITRGLPSTFRIVDELYRYERTDSDAPVRVLAIGRSLQSGAEFPVLWTVERARGRTVALTLGHDGRAHELAEFRTLLTNSVNWILDR